MESTLGSHRPPPPHTYIVYIKMYALLNKTGYCGQIVVFICIKWTCVGSRGDCCPLLSFSPLILASPLQQRSPPQSAPIFSSPLLSSPVISSPFIGSPLLTMHKVIIFITHNKNIGIDNDIVTLLLLLCSFLRFNTFKMNTETVQCLAKPLVHTNHAQNCNINSSLLSVVVIVITFANDSFCQWWVVVCFSIQCFFLNLGLYFSD